MEQNQILSNAAGAIGIHLGERERFLFSLYERELLIWGRKINLISVRSSYDIPIKHFVDSLTPVPFIKNSKGLALNEEGKILDIGTGAGFPGIPLKIAIDPLKVHLLETSRKKVSFLKHIVRTLGLDEVTIIHGRCEEIMEKEIYRHIFDVVISRATFKLSQFLLMGAFFLSHNGILIAMKGPNIDGELKEAATTSEKTGLVCVGCHDVKLPIIGDPRKIVIYKKL